jgi:hypothetical protein
MGKYFQYTVFGRSVNPIPPTPASLFKTIEIYFTLIWQVKVASFICSSNAMKLLRIFTVCFPLKSLLVYKQNDSIILTVYHRLKVSFFQKIRCVFQISKKKNIPKTILNLKFKFPSNNNKVLLVGNLNFKHSDQSIASTKTKYIKLNTRTPIFLITFNFCIHFKRENFFFSFFFLVAPVKVYKKVVTFSIKTTKNILGLGTYIP